MLFEFELDPGLPPTVRKELGAYRESVNAEMVFLRDKGGRRHRIFNGERIRREKTGSIYCFDLEAELFLSDDAPVSVDVEKRSVRGQVVACEDFQITLSLEDDLMRLFGGDRMDKIQAMMQRYDMPRDMPIQAKMVTKAVEGAQRKVEEINFAMRKNVLEYDDVMNKQRQVIYEERNKILDGKDLTEHVNEVTSDTVWHKVSEFCPESDDPETWDLEGLAKWLENLTGRKEGLPEFSVEDETATISDRVEEFVRACYAEKTEKLGDAIMHELSAQIMLRVIDTRWMAYLQEMDYLKTGIGLRGFGQRDPLVEYKSEAYAAFSVLVNTMYEDFLRTILRIELQSAPVRRAASQDEEEPEELRGARYSAATVDGDQRRQGAQVPATATQAPAAPQATTAPASDLTKVKAPMRSFTEVEQAPDQTKRVPYRKADSLDPYANVGRNDPCPCGSGKKFKNCHGRRGA